MNLQIYGKGSRLCTYVDCLESKGPVVIYDTEDDDLYFCLKPAERLSTDSGSPLN